MALNMHCLTEFIILIFLILINWVLKSGLAVSSAKRKLPEETAEEMEGKKHFLPQKNRKKRKKLNKILSHKYFCTKLLQKGSKRPTTAI